MKLYTRCLSSPSSACGWYGCMNAPVPGLLMRPSLCTAECRGLRPALTSTSVDQVEKWSTGRARDTSKERGARWENIKMRWKRAQLWLLVNNTKEVRAREERVVAVETEQRLEYYWQDWSGRGRMWRNSLLFTPACLSFSPVRAVKCFMCLEHCGFPLCYFSECSDSGLLENQYQSAICSF